MTAKKKGGHLAALSRCRRMKRPADIQSAGPSFPLKTADQVQVIRPLTEEAHVLVVSVCDAVADHPAGGPATAVAVTVTFCDGVKPWAEPLPEKYVPALSAA